MELPTIENVPTIITIHYYNSITRDYDATNATKTGVNIEALAEKGKRIVGVFDSDGVQYADYQCCVNVSKGCPADLYVRYDDAIRHYSGGTTFEENPIYISYYSGRKISYDYAQPSTGTEIQLASSLKCNPYAQVTITVSFLLKGSSKSNRFQSFIWVGNETLASIEEVKNYSEWTSCSMTASVSAMQIVKNNYKIIAGFRSSYGYEDYMIKNIKIAYDISYN